jgi:hypothetical protein
MANAGASSRLERAAAIRLRARDARREAGQARTHAAAIFERRSVEPVEARPSHQVGAAGGEVTAADV